MASSVLQSLFQNSKSPLSEQFVRWKVWNSWEEVVGKEIGKHTLPVGYNKKRLYIWVSNAARMQEMTFLVRPIMNKINTFCGEKWVKSIQFTLDRKSVARPQETSQDLRDFLSKEPPNEDEGQ